MNEKKFIKKHDDNYSKIKKNLVDPDPIPIGSISDPESGEKIPVMPIQPIIFRGPNSKDNVAPEDLYSAPLNAAGQHNLYVMQHCFDEYVKTIGMTAFELDIHQKNMTVDMCIEYLLRNTFNNYCIMVDGVGPQFGSVIRYIPLKQCVHEYLFEEKGATTRISIQCILESFFNNRYVSHQKTYENTENINESALASIFNYLDVITMQISELLFAVICYGTEEAVTTTYLNVYNSPNAKTMYENAIKVCGVKDINNETPMFLAGLIKRALLGNINLMMSAAIQPSVKELLSGLAANSYFVYGTINTEYKNQQKCATAVNAPAPVAQVPCNAKTAKSCTNKCDETCPCRESCPIVIHF